MAGRYPKFNVLDNYDHWDKDTQTLIKRRLEEPGPLQFLREQEARIYLALLKVMLEEEDERLVRRVAGHVDYNIAQGIGDGYRQTGLPDDATLYREGLLGIEETARELLQEGFLNLPPDRQRSILRAVAAGNPPGQRWQKVPARVFFKKVLLDAVSVFYSQPEIWTEIGYAGPAYPRGYVRIEWGAWDPWEAVADD